MLDQISKLIIKVQLRRVRPEDALAESLELLAREVEKRVAFERAMVQYLQDSPSAPFAASEAFVKWLQFDTESE
jgi:hypothetical protein